MLESREERVAFLERRQEGVGGSDIPPLVRPLRRSDGAVYRDVLDVYLEKTRPVSPNDAVDPDILRGLLLEEPISQLYAEFSGNKTRRMGRRKGSEDFFQAHTDRMVPADDDRVEGKRSTGAMEAKAPRTYGFGNVLEEGFPERYVAQLQWELACTGYDWGVIVVGNLEHDRGPIVYHDMPRHEGLIPGLESLAYRFWTEHVVPREPPVPEVWYGDTPDLVVPEVEGERRVVNTPDARWLAYKLMRRYVIRRRAKKLYKEAKGDFKEYLERTGREDVQRMLVPGYGKVNWDFREGRTSWKSSFQNVAEHEPLDRDATFRALRDRYGLSDAEVEEILDGCSLDMDGMIESGSPYRAFRPYPEHDNPDAYPDPSIDPLEEPNDD